MKVAGATKSRKKADTGPHHKTAVKTETSAMLNKRLFAAISKKGRIKAESRGEWQL